jgi:pyridoxamine 5'-phosphate oxidase
MKNAEKNATPFEGARTLGRFSMALPSVCEKFRPLGSITLKRPEGRAPPGHPPFSTLNSQLFILPAMSIADIRRDYNLAGLRRSDLDPDPIALFRRWFDQAAGARQGGQLRSAAIRVYKSLLGMGSAERIDVNAATLATVDAEGRPSARVVLLKGVDERGFIFFTNYDSRKGREIAGNANVALVFYWPDQERQVTIAGAAAKVPVAESEAYFKSRPRGSRLAAWASHQSEAIENREVLEAHWRELEAKYPGDAVPMPPNWGGFVIAPVRMEFWQGRPSRLHDRFRYLKDGGSWKIERLSP